MNNNVFKDIVSDPSLLNRFLKDLAAGNVMQDGKSINNISNLEAGKPIQFGNATLEDITFDAEQLKFVASEYQRKVDSYKENLKNVFSKRADYDKALDEIRIVYNRLHDCEQKISALTNKHIENLSSAEVRELEDLYNERIRLNEQYVNYQQGLISFVHIDEKGLGAVTDSEMALRNYVNPEMRAEIEKNIICSEEFTRSEPFFDVSINNKQINILKNSKVKLISGKLTKFTKDMFNKMTGKFVPRKDGILAKLSSFTQKFTDKDILEKNVHAFTRDMAVNDMLSLCFNSVYKLEKNRIKNESDCTRLTSDEIAALVDGSISRNVMPPEILDRLNTRVSESLDKINNDMNINGLSDLQALNNAVHFSQTDYNKKKDLLNSYAKASNKLFKKELNDFKEKTKGLNISDLKDDTSTFDIRSVPNFEKSEEVQDEEQVHETVNAVDKVNTEVMDTEQVLDNNSVSNTKPINDALDVDSLENDNVSENLTVSSQSIDTDLNSENKEDVEKVESAEAQSKESSFITASNDYIASLENERGQLLQEYDERKNALREALERANARKVKYGDSVPEMNEDPVVIAIQTEVNAIGKRMEKLASDIEYEETKLEKLKNKHFISQSKLDEKSMIIDDYNNGIKGLENDLRDARVAPQSQFGSEETLNNVERASIFGNVEDTIDEDITNDRVLNEYKTNLNNLQEETDILKSDDITDILNHFEEMEFAINNNENLSSEDKDKARKQLWENFAEYTATIEEQSYKPRSR